MSRQLVAYVERIAEEEGQNPSEGSGQRSGLEHWPSLVTAQKGAFEHVVLIASPRFRWDEVLAGPDDRLLPDAIPAEEPPAPAAAAEPAAAEPADAAEPAAVPEAEAPAAETPAAEPAEAAVPEAEATEAPAPAAEAPRAEGTSSEERAKEPPTRAREPKRAPARTLGELRSRLHHMAQSGRSDRGALEQLGAELGRELGIPSVACRVIPPFARDREQVALIRSVLGLLRTRLPAVLEFADGPRSTAGLGLTLAHGITSLRTDVPIAELATDRSRNLGVHPRSLLHAIEIQELWKTASSGGPSPALFDHMRADPRLQNLVAPLQRLARAIEFGNPAEAARAARTVKERLSPAEKGRDRDDWSAAVAPVVGAVADALASDRPWSRRQLWMAEGSEKRGTHFLTAMHLREALISGLLETYGQNAARGWAPAGAEGVDTKIRPREVMVVVLNDPESARLVSDLGQVWQWVGSPRNKFVMTSPIALDPALLRDGNRALTTLIPLTKAILEEGRLRAIVEALPWDKAIELAVTQNAVRVAPARSRRAQRRTREDAEAGGAPAESQGSPPAEGQPPRGESGAPPSRPAFPRERRRPRQQEPRRPGHDRPREVAAHARHESGPRRDRGPGGGPETSGPVTSIPVGGVIKVERASHGLGNLGLALRNAGLNPSPRGQKDKPQQKPAAAAPQAAAESAAEASVAATPAAPPAPQIPVESAPNPAAPDFDVAGPAPAEPPA